MSVDHLFRNWLADLGEGWVIGVEAQKFVAHMRETDPSALAEWLDENAAQFLADRGGAWERSLRATAMRRMGARRFQELAAEGDPEALRSIFASSYVVDDGNTRKRLADMTGADHRFVADAYESEGKTLMLLGAFHRALAKKVGNRRTEDVLTAEKVETLFASITQRGTAAA